MNLSPLVYQFLVGGAIFSAGLFISWFSKDYSWKKREDRLTFIFIVAGYFLYCVFQTVWHFIALGKI
jgi:hypothetical protein